MMQPPPCFLKGTVCELQSLFCATHGGILHVEQVLFKVDRVQWAEQECKPLFSDFLFRKT